MARQLIAWPMLAQVLLTAAVWVRMYVVRVAEMRRRGIRPQSIATSRAIAGTLEDTAPADNFRNLFEVPVLFFAVCLTLMALDLVIPAQLALAWAFVGLRCLHSGIQLTSNRVMSRFRVYVLGTVCVFAMWVVLAFQLVNESGSQAQLAERVLALAGGATAGIEVVLAEPGRVHLAVGRRADLLQFRGYFHGGAISGLADLAAGGAVATMLPDGRAVVTISLHVNFLAPAKGERLVAKGTVVKVGGMVGVASVEVVTRDGGQEHLCATATATFRIVSAG